MPRAEARQGTPGAQDTRSRSTRRRNTARATNVPRRPPTRRTADRRPAADCASFAGRARLPSRAGRRPVPSQAIQEGFPWRRRILGRPSSSSMNRASRGPGTTSPPTCRSHRRRISIRPPAQPIGPDRPRAALPDGAHRPGGLGGARDRDPRTGPRRLSPLPAEPALPRASARTRPRYPGPHLLQVRGRQPGRQPQAEHGARRRPSTTRKRASSASRPRPVPANGGVPWPSPAPTSGSRSRSTWSAPATTRSRTGGS